MSCSRSQRFQSSLTSFRIGLPRQTSWCSILTTPTTPTTTTLRAPSSSSSPRASSSPSSPSSASSARSCQSGSSSAEMSGLHKCLIRTVVSRVEKRLRKKGKKDLLPLYAPLIGTTFLNLPTIQTQKYSAALFKGPPLAQEETICISDLILKVSEIKCNES